MGEARRRRLFDVDFGIPRLLIGQSMDTNDHAVILDHRSHKTRVSRHENLKEAKKALDLGEVCLSTFSVNDKNNKNFVYKFCRHFWADYLFPDHEYVYQKESLK